MITLTLRRLALLPPLLLLTHLAGFVYAVVAQRLQAARNPFVAPLLGVEELSPLGRYWSYLQQASVGEWGTIPGGRGEMLPFLMESVRASLGLLGIVFAISLLVGLLLGFAAVQVHPPGASTWLIPLSTVGLAMPGFYVGIVLVAGMILYTLRTFSAPPLPFQGFGWDEHLVLPVIALALRPTLQLAQTLSRLLGEELRRQYVVAARSLGYSWRRIRWRAALRNVLAPLLVTIAGSFRLLLGELILVELLFNWPGIGRVLALTLIPPVTSAAQRGFFFLNPALLALALTFFALLFLLADWLSALLVQLVDPRLRLVEEPNHV